MEGTGGRRRWGPREQTKECRRTQREYDGKTGQQKNRAGRQVGRTECAAKGCEGTRWEWTKQNGVGAFSVLRQPCVLGGNTEIKRAREEVESSEK